MALEILVAFCILSTGFLTGYFLAAQKQQAKKELDFHQKAEALNLNLTNFSKAYDDFVLKCVDSDSRLTSLEFKVNGFVNKK